VSLNLKQGMGVRLLVGEGAVQAPLETTILAVDGNQLQLATGGAVEPEQRIELENRRLRAMVCRPDAMYTFEGQSGPLHPDGQRSLLRFTLDSLPRRHQRRRWFRVERSLPLELWLPLENKALQELGGERLIRDYWVRGHSHNLGAGGLKVKLELPPGHALPEHREARVDLRAEDGVDQVELEGRQLQFLRIEGAPEAGVLVYAFADLVEDERNRLHKLVIRFEQERMRKALKEDPR
jgi:c-di-GMP-binding flagellar brake protein YcgR